MEAITSFRGKYDFLSNFYNVPIEYEGRTYRNSEALFQSFKNDDPAYKDSLTWVEPKVAKSLGKQVKLREDWEEVKLDCMYEAIKVKFLQHEYLKQKLLDTGDAVIVEGNTWNDTYWGVCNGVGNNYLGYILMLVRKHIREGIID